jgi:hypothetical protein
MILTLGTLQGQAAGDQAFAEQAIAEQAQTTHNQTCMLAAPQIGLGITYLAAKEGATPEETTVIGAVVLYESVVQGAIWGFAFGGVAGATASAVVGM